MPILANREIPYVRILMEEENVTKILIEGETPSNTNVGVAPATTDEHKDIRTITGKQGVTLSKTDTQRVTVHANTQKIMFNTDTQTDTVPILMHRYVLYQHCFAERYRTNADTLPLLMQ